MGGVSLQEKCLANTTVITGEKSQRRVILVGMLIVAELVKEPLASTKP